MMPATMPKWSISSTLMSSTEKVIFQKYTVSTLVPAECGLEAVAITIFIALLVKPLF